MKMFVSVSKFYCQIMFFKNRESIKPEVKEENNFKETTKFSAVLKIRIRCFRKILAFWIRIYPDVS